MSDVPMPRDLSEEAVALWLQAHGGATYVSLARAVRALVRAKVREAVEATKDATDPYCECDNRGTGGRIHLRFDATDAIIARVMGDHPSNASGGHESEGREAPRG